MQNINKTDSNMLFSILLSVVDVNVVFTKVVIKLISYVALSILESDKSYGYLINSVT